MECTSLTCFSGGCILSQSQSLTGNNHFVLVLKVEHRSVPLLHGELLTQAVLVVASLANSFEYCVNCVRDLSLVYIDGLTLGREGGHHLLSCNLVLDLRPPSVEIATSLEAGIHLNQVSEQLCLHLVAVLREADFILY